MVHRIQEHKPSLKQGGGVVDTSDVKPALAYDANSDIIMFSEESWLSIVISWVKSGLMFLLSAFLIFLVLYITLAVSLLFVTVVGDKTVAVARGTFLGGEPALLDVVLTSPTEETSEDPLNRLKVGFMGIENPQIVRVQSGPLDTVVAKNGKITVSGKAALSYDGVLVDKNNNPAEMNDKLVSQYLVQCVSGSCEPGKFFIVDQANIFGKIQTLNGSN
jgi:hypothetical protein